MANRQPVIIEGLTPAQRTQIFHSVVDRVHALENWDHFSEDRKALEALRLNPELHKSGVHVDLAPGEDALRIRLILKVDDIRDIVGADFTDRDIVTEFLEEFPTAQALDIEIDGLPHLALIGNWARLSFNPGPQKRSKASERSAE